MYQFPILTVGPVLAENGNDCGENNLHMKSFPHVHVNLPVILDPVPPLEYETSLFS